VKSVIKKNLEKNGTNLGKTAAALDRQECNRVVTQWIYLDAG